MCNPTCGEELLKYMVNTLAFVLPWDCEIPISRCSDVLYLLYMPGRRAFTIPFFFCPMLRCVGLNFNWQDAVLS